MDNNSESENLNGMEVNISPNTEVSFVRSLKGVYKVWHLGKPDVTTLSGTMIPLVGSSYH